MITRKGSAHWEGGLKTGKGHLNAPSGVMKDTPYSFHTRFEEVQGTNPEELIALAHAGCFSMALSAQLEKRGFIAKSIDTVASVTMEQKEQGFTITRIHLNLNANVPGISKEVFDEASLAAKEGCPISRVLNAEILLSATLS